MYRKNETEFETRWLMIAGSQWLLPIFLVVGLLLPLSANAQENCTNEIDDDADGLVDCLDNDCFDDLACGCIQETEHLLSAPGGFSNWLATVDSVAVDGDFMVVGVIHGDGVSVRSGTAYVYRRDPDTGTFGPEPMQEIFASDGGVHYLFGSSVAIEGGVIVVGAYKSTEGDESYAGSAHIFRLQGGPGQQQWLEEQELIPDYPVVWGEFGESVAISGDVIAVGAPGMGGNDSSGAVFLYKYQPDDSQGQDLTPWKFQQKIADHDQWKSGETPHSRLGESVALSGDVLVIGSTNYNSHNSFSYGAFNTGIVFVYQLSATGEWLLEAEMLPEDLTWQGVDLPKPKLFGLSVSISGDTIAVGSYTGCAYIFERDALTGEWPSVETQKLFLGFTSEFGFEVAIDGDLLVVAAQEGDVQGFNSGNAFLFRKNTAGFLGEQWLLGGQLCGSTVGAEDLFGTSAAISGETVVIASTAESNPGSAYGSTWVYEIEIPFQPVECNAEGIAASCEGLGELVVEVAISNPSSVTGDRVLLPDLIEFPDGGFVVYSPSEIVLDPPLAEGATSFIEVGISSNIATDLAQIPMSLMHDNDDGTSFLVCDPVAFVSLAAVVDNAPPYIVCPGEQNITINPFAHWRFGWIYSRKPLPDYTDSQLTEVSDACGAVVEVIQSPPPGGLYSRGTTVEVTLTAVDDSGNSTSCIFEVNFLTGSTPPWGFSVYNYQSSSPFPSPWSRTP